MSANNRPKRSKKRVFNFSGMDGEVDDDRDSTYECDGDDSDDSYSFEMQNQNHNKVKAGRSTKSLPANRKYQF